MKIVVTGASGFVGRAVIAPLLAAGFEVHAIARAPIPGVTTHALDLLAADPAPLLAAIAPTHVLHLAWYAEPGKFWHAPQNLDWLAAPLRLARAFADAGGQRLVTAGSCAEYDWTHPRLDEATTPIAPATLYGTAKAALFRVITAAALPPSYAHARIFFPYGPGERAGRLLPDVIDAVLAGRHVATSDGRQTRDFIHVEDTGAAIAALLGSSATGAVNIASGTARPLRDIIGMAAALAGDAGLVDWGARPRQPSEPAVMEAVTHRLHSEIGFTPRWSLETGLADMVARRRLP
ncbi:MAG: NAD(P)-dependent oxidoreductase [Sandarakinorhabdus sp.]|nr:NAD(P)-dependent oxidoreductase [Sandarakinorhabdus sp.]